MNEFVFYFINKNFKYFLNNFWTAHCSARDSFSSICLPKLFYFFNTTGKLHFKWSKLWGTSGSKGNNIFLSDNIIQCAHSFWRNVANFEIDSASPTVSLFFFFFLLQPQYSIWSAFSFFSGHELFPCNLVFYCILGKHNHQLEGNLPFRTCRK